MADNDPKQFEYIGLKPREIRLLRPSQDDNSGKIICEFKTVSLDKLEIGYLPISYCWGDGTLTDTIWFHDNRFLKVTKSVPNIIRYFTSKNFSGHLWIDAICINQADAIEKGQQVQLMQEIYGRVEYVVAWIERVSSKCDVVPSFINRLNSAVTELLRAKKPITGEAISEFPGCEYPSPAWRALAFFLDLPWFRRVWIIQEVVLAKQMGIVYGDEIITWSILGRVITVINNIGLHYMLEGSDDTGEFVAPEGIKNISVMYAFKIIRDSGAPVTIQACLLDSRNFKATDPRDKMFAMLGIATDVDDPVLVPDYVQNTHVIYTKFTAYLLERDCSLRYLHAAGIGLPRSLLNIPSWVADWSCPYFATNFGSIAERAEYRAAGESKVRVLEISKDLDSPTLVIEGCIIDRIKTIHSPVPRELKEYEPGGEFLILEEQLIWFAKLTHILYSLEPYPTGEKIHDVCWRTLIANVSYTGKNGTPAPQEYAEYFNDYWNLKYLMIKCRSTRVVQGGTQEMVDGSQLWVSAMSPVSQRVLFTTDRGYAGIGQAELKEGDEVCIFHGAATPFILRKEERDENFKPRHVLVGECYIHGLMNGEGLEMAPSKPIILI